MWGGRIQGTDGIRGEVALSTDARVKGLGALQAFFERRLLTEKFFQMYAYCATLDLLKTGDGKKKRGIVLGWDPRDPKGVFVDAVKSGIKKAGADVISIGIIPTPSVPMYMSYIGASGGMMLTASHNPKDQNGIKIFYSLRGLKPLPEDDMRITKLIYENENLDIDSLPEKGRDIEKSEEAKRLFIDFALDPRNSWIDERDPFRNMILVVDPANGSYSHLASEIFVRLGFSKVIELNHDIENGNVNEDCGVASLEGFTVITPEMVFGTTGGKITPIFSKHSAVKRIFEEGRSKVEVIKKGEVEVCGAIFDADGDRFYRLDYNPLNDTILVSSGDETAYHQIKFLVSSNPSKFKGSLYVNTVESDLLVANSLAEIGVKPLTIPVGDKWILQQAVLNDLSNIFEKAKADLLSKEQVVKLEEISAEFDELKESGMNSVAKMYAFFRKLEQNGLLLADDFKKPYAKRKSAEFDENAPVFNYFSVGAEETGHNITEGFLVKNEGESQSVFAGNGVKSAINTFAATAYLYDKLPAKEYFKVIKEPFHRGYKRTFYAYYTNKKMFGKGKPLFKQAKSKIKGVFEDVFLDQKFRFDLIEYPQEPDLLYLKVVNDRGVHKCSLFMRNSGTEEKTAFYIRGEREFQDKYYKVGAEVIMFIMINMKNFESEYAKAELEVLRAIEKEKIVKDGLREFLKGNTDIGEDSFDRFITELQIQNFIKSIPHPDGLKDAISYKVTPFAKKYLKSIETISKSI